MLEVALLEVAVLILSACGVDTQSGVTGSGGLVHSGDESRVNSSATVGTEPDGIQL